MQYKMVGITKTVLPMVATVHRVLKMCQFCSYSKEQFTCLLEAEQSQHSHANSMQCTEDCPQSSVQCNAMQ